MAKEQSGSDMSLSHGNLRKTMVASFIGNFVEWFDYAVYGYLAVIIAAVFFPQTDSKTALIATFALFALSFVVRPLGGIVWGYFGDRYGRRDALSYSILIMSFSTFLIGCLPVYEHVGIAAPILLTLLRIVQGFSASGEYSGAAIYMVESAPVARRGFYASIVPASTATGLLFGSLFATMLYMTLNSEQLHDWGWRIPFLLAAPFGLIGRYIRVHLEDSPEFIAFKKREAGEVERESFPLRDLLVKYHQEILVSFGVTCLNAVGFYILLSYLPTYMSAELGVEETTSFMLSTVTLSVYIGLIFGMGLLSDKIGRYRILMLASILFMILAVPLFMLIETGVLVTVMIAQIILAMLLSMNDGSLASFLSEIFPLRVRYSGMAFSFNSANALFGGTAPLIATWMIGVTGDKLAPAYYLVVAAFVALMTLYYGRKVIARAYKEYD